MWTSILIPSTATNWNIEVIDPKNKLLTFRNLAIHRSSFGMTFFHTNLKRYLTQMISFNMKLKFIDKRPLVNTTQYPQKLGKGTEIIFRTTKLKDVKLWHKIKLFPRVYNYEETKVRSSHNWIMLIVICCNCVMYIPYFRNYYPRVLFNLSTFSNQFYLIKCAKIRVQFEVRVLLTVGQ